MFKPTQPVQVEHVQTRESGEPIYYWRNALYIQLDGGYPTVLYADGQFQTLSEQHKIRPFVDDTPYKPLAEMLRRALHEIAALKGQCIFGKPEYINLYRDDPVIQEYRNGSADAFIQAAAIAEKALAHYQSARSY